MSPSKHADPRRITSKDGTELALWDLGGSGPNLLFAHATGFCAQVWQPMAEELADQFRCFALDVRGHGRSDPRPRQLGWDRVGEDVDAAVEAIGDEVLGVGHSMGGAGLLLANTTEGSASNRRLSGMWLFEPIVFPPEIRTTLEAENRLATGARKRRATFSSREEAYENYASKPPLSSLSAPALRAYVDHGFEAVSDRVTLRCRPEVEAAFYDGGAHHDGWERCPQVAIPTAIAVGAELANSPAALAPIIATRIPNAELVELRHLGHFGPLEALAECARMVAQFALNRP